jgi:hypothetical protein
MIGVGEYRHTFRCCRLSCKSLLSSKSSESHVSMFAYISTALYLRVHVG